MKLFTNAQKATLNSRKISFSMCVIATTLFAISPSILAQQRETVTPVRGQQIEAETIQPPSDGQQGASGTLSSGPSDNLEYECHDYVCVCSIGDDCKEMMDTLSVNNCWEGGPGELECSVDPRD